MFCLISHTYYDENKSWIISYRLSYNVPRSWYRYSGRVGEHQEPEIINSTLEEIGLILDSHSASTEYGASFVGPRGILKAVTCTFDICTMYKWHLTFDIIMYI